MGFCGEKLHEHYRISSNKRLRRLLNFETVFCGQSGWL